MYATLQGHTSARAGSQAALIKAVGNATTRVLPGSVISIYARLPAISPRPRKTVVRPKQVIDLNLDEEDDGIVAMLARRKTATA